MIANDIFKEGLNRMKKRPPDYAGAKECFTECIALRPAQSKYFFARGNAYRSLGDFKRCLLDYTMAIRIDDTIPAYLGSRGICFRIMGRLQESLRDFERAIELSEGKNGIFFYNRGLTYYDLGEKEKVLPS